MSLLLLLRPPVAQQTFTATVTPTAIFVRKPLVRFPASLTFAGTRTAAPKVPLATFLNLSGNTKQRVTFPTFAASVSFVGTFAKIRVNALRAFAASIQPWGKGGIGPVGYIDIFLPPYKWVERIYQSLKGWD